MIAELKLAAAVGIAAFLAMCVSTAPVRHSYKHHAKAHHKIAHEAYVPTPVPTPSVVVIMVPASGDKTPQPPPSITPPYKSSVHQHPPWSSDFRPAP